MSDEVVKDGPPRIQLKGVDCPECEGTGRVHPGMLCHHCHGTKVVFPHGKLEMVRESYISEAGEKGTVVHAKRKEVSCLDRMYHRMGSITEAQYKAGQEFYNDFMRSTLIGHPKLSVLEKIDGGTRRLDHGYRLEATERIYDIRWRLGSTRSWLAEHIIIHGRTLQQAANASQSAPIGVNAFGKDKASALLHEALEVIDDFYFGRLRRRPKMGAVIYG